MQRIHAFGGVKETVIHTHTRSQHSASSSVEFIDSENRRPRDDFADGAVIRKKAMAGIQMVTVLLVLTLLSVRGDGVYVGVGA